MQRNESSKLNSSFCYFQNFTCDSVSPPVQPMPCFLMVKGVDTMYANLVVNPFYLLMKFKDVSKLRLSKPEFLTMVYNVGL